MQPHSTAAPWSAFLCSQASSHRRGFFLNLFTCRARLILAPSTPGSNACRIASVLVSHFLLDLQEASRRAVKLGSEDPLYSDRSVSLTFSSLGAIAHPDSSEQSTVVFADDRGQEDSVGMSDV